MRMVCSCVKLKKRSSSAIGVNTHLQRPVNASVRTDRELVEAKTFSLSGFLYIPG